MNPAVMGPSDGSRSVKRWFRSRRLALLAIPLAATTIATPFITSPFHDNGKAPLVVRSTDWFQNRLGAADSFFGYVTPARTSSADSARVEVGLRFKALQGGSVTAIRFYKGSGNTGTHVGHLWDASGKLLASVTFRGETAKGWQQATLANAIHLKTGTTYIVSYVAPRGHYAGDTGYFNQSRTTRWLYAFASSEGGNGVFTYGDGFPISSRNAVNYYVDISFRADLTGHITGTTDPPTTTIPAPTPPPETTTVPVTDPPATSPPATSPPTTSPPTTSPTTAPPVVDPPTTAATTTTTTAPAPQGPSGGPGCGLAAAAFCETFDAPRGTGSRTGDLDPVLWGVSRVGNINPGQDLLNDIAQVSMTGCGTTAWSLAPSDVRICNGRMFETVNDGGGVANLDTYPKQPFNFAGRTGTVTFDVSADSDGSHAAWPEFVITDKPVPGVRVSISEQQSAAAVNEIGFSLDGCAGATGSTTGVGTVFMTNNGNYSQPSFTSTGCVTKGNADALNHFEVRISQTHLEVWGTNPGGGTLTQLAVADVNLGFTQGLVWLNDVHYNARKAIEPCECGTQWNHTFVWDNLGFDGPKTYRDLGFDVPDANILGGVTANGDPTRRVGYLVGTGPLPLTVTGVRRNQTPTAAQVVLNTYTFGSTLPSVSVNGGPWIDTPWPAGAQSYAWRSLSIPVPVSQVLDGANILTFRSGDISTTIANVSIILVAAAAVP